MRRRFARVLATLIATTLVAGAFSLVAGAGHVVVHDPDDTRGPLDVRRVHLRGAAKQRWKVVTWNAWTVPEVFDTGYLMVNIDTFKSPRPDYYVLVGSNGRKMYAHLWRDRPRKRPYRVTRLAVWRPNKRSVSVRLPLAKMKIGPRRTFFRWHVETLFSGPGCRRVCFDLAPDRGAVIEPLPFVTPKPSVSPTPTTTPTATPTATPDPSPTD